MAMCGHCRRRKDKGQPPCKDHRIGDSMEGKTASRTRSVVAMQGNYRRKKNGQL